ncbi:amidohydrolase family protein [Botrimarina hoheduenensis]|uniref:Aminodeoxyfutalosine deaminase n=1 Tax=Botrimarina hoheduenensis TaxID=2528000 RepID=A0A5C5VNS5_9BACT|nr:amidohydrolase family protein [Botrimarina hoheduenensis]TWT40268.1 Aminodeoxyfutalosine deaminase [Botrimarina hoheduenensis]
MTIQAFRARVVFPVAAPPIEDGVVVIEAGRIVRIGRQAPANAEVEDLGDVALMPGFVNAHCHLEFSHLKRRVGRKGVTLPTWIRQIIEKRPPAKKIGKAISGGLEQSLRSGTTTLAEICRTETEAYATTAPSPRLVLLQESIGFSQARAGSALAAAEQRLQELHDFVHGQLVRQASGTDGAAINNEALDRGLALNGAAPLPSKWVGGKYRVGVSPHAPYTASPQLIRELVSVAVSQDMPVALHLAESPEELQLLNEGKGPFQQILEERGMWDPWVIGRGSTPLDYLRMLTRAPKALVVHGNYLDYPALAMMARHSSAMSLVYCPRTHAHFKHTPYPLATALELGVPVCLGTDSLASNPDLSILGEMREVAARHPQVDPVEILRMGTLAGAQALGLTDVGAIRPGAHADLVSVPFPTGVEGRPAELFGRLLAEEIDVDTVWLGGQRMGAVAV